MKKLGKIAKLITVTALGAALMAGCGNSSSNTASTTDSNANQTTADTTQASTGAQTVTVSMDGATAPFNYQDEDGELVGYEVDLLKEIETRSDGKLHFEVWMQARHR